MDFVTVKSFYSGINLNLKKLQTHIQTKTYEDQFRVEHCGPMKKQKNSLSSCESLNVLQLLTFLSNIKWKSEHWLLSVCSGITQSYNFPQIFFSGTFPSISKALAKDPQNRQMRIWDQKNKIKKNSTFEMKLKQTESVKNHYWTSLNPFNDSFL